jgi:thioredoxin-dependent peroxiredoxin
MSALSKYRVQFFGASVDPVELNKQFSEKNSYNFPLLSDPDKTYAKALGVLNAERGFANRWTYIIDEQGVIRHVDKMVKPANHGKDLAAKLDELGIPKK